MAGIVIAALPAYAPVSPTPAVMLPMVDPADTSASPQGTTKQMTVSQLFNAPTFAGVVTVGGAIILGSMGSFSQQGQIGRNSVRGTVIQAYVGTTNDFSIYNPNGGAYIMQVPTGTLNVLFGGNITVPGNLTSTLHVNICGPTSALGFFQGAQGTRQTVTGSAGGNAALSSLLAALATYSLIINNTTA